MSSTLALALAEVTRSKNHVASALIVQALAQLVVLVGADRSAAAADTDAEDVEGA